MASDDQGQVVPPEPVALEDALAPRVGRRWLKRGAWVGFGLVVLLTLLPTLFSLAGGGGWVAGWISNRVAGTVEVEGLRVGWLSSLRVERLVVQDENGQAILVAEGVQTRRLGLWAWAGRLGALDVLEVEVRSLQFDVVALADGRTNLEVALTPRPSSASSGPKPSRPATPEPSEPRPKPDAEADEGVRYPLPVGVRFSVASVSGRYTAGDGTVVDVDLDEAMAEAMSPTRLLLRAHGEVRSGGVSGTLLADVTLSDLFDEDGAFQPERAVGEGELLLDHWPTGVLSVLGLEAEMAEQILGQTVTLSASVSGDAGTILGNVSVTSGAAEDERLGSVLALSWTPAGLVQTQPGVLRLRLTPSAAEEVFGWELADEVVLAGRLDGLSLPRAAEQWAWRDAAGRLTFEMSPGRLMVPEVGWVDFAGATGEVETEAMGERVTGMLVAEASLKGRPGRLAVDAAWTQGLTAEHGLNEQGMALEVVGKATRLPAFVLVDVLTDAGRKWRTLGGEWLDTTLTVQVGEGLNGPVRLAAATDAGALHLAGRMQSGRLVLDGSQGVYRLPERSHEPISAALDEALALDGELLHFRGSPEVRVKLPRFEVPLDADAWVDGQVTAGMTMRRAVLERHERLEGVALRQVVVEVDSDRLADGLAVNWRGQPTHYRERGEVTGDALWRLVDPDSGQVEPRLVSMTTSAAGLPTRAMEKLVGRSVQWEPFLGDALAGMTVTLTGDPRESALFLVQLESDGVELDVTGTWADAEAGGVVDVARGGLTLGVDAERLRLLMGTPADAPGDLGGATLANEVAVRVDVSRLRVPLLEVVEGVSESANRVDLARVGMDVRVEATNALLQDSEGGTTLVHRMAATVVSDNPLEELRVGLDAYIVSPDLAEADGMLDGSPTLATETSVTGLYLTPTYELVTDHAALRTQTRLDAIPVRLIDDLAETGDFFTRLLGPVTDLTADVRFPGESLVRVDTENLAFNLPLVSEGRDALVLGEGAALSFELRELPDNALLRELHPVFNFLLDTRLVTLAPVELTLDAGGRVPLWESFSLESIQVSGGLALGAIEMESGSDAVAIFQRYGLKSIEDMFGEESLRVMQGVNLAMRLRGQQPLFGAGMSDEAFDRPGADQRSLATFTPVTFSLNDGIVRSAEGWFESRGLRLGFVGQTDLASGEVDYTVGVPGDLIAAFEPRVLGRLVDPARVYEYAVTGQADGEPEVWSQRLYDYLSGALPDAIRAAALGEASGDPLSLWGRRLVGGPEPSRDWQVPEAPEDGR